MRISGKKNRALSVAIAMQVMFGAGTVMAADTTTGDNKGTICASTSEGGNTTCGNAVALNVMSGNAATGQSSLASGTDNKALGKASITIGGSKNTATEDNTAVIGGTGNASTGTNAIVAGGEGNTASGYDSFAAGFGNTAQGVATTTFGHQNKVVDNSFSAGIFAGETNTISSSQGSVIEGGAENTISKYAYDSSISGGLSNTITDNSDQAAIVGGINSYIQHGNKSVILGGDANSIIHKSKEGLVLNLPDDTRLAELVNKENYIKDGQSYGDAILAGHENVLTGNTYYTNILGGQGNYITNAEFSIAGGLNNAVVGTSADNLITNAISLGGYGNAATKNFAATYGGAYNLASGVASTAIGGGSVDKGNTASGDYSLTAGGIKNTASGQGAAVMGGEGNKADGVDAIAAGSYNSAKGKMSVVLGGSGNTVDSGASQSSIIAGNFNNVSDSSSESVILGGDGNNIKNNSLESVIAGSIGSEINKSYSSVIAGTKYADMNDADSTAMIGGEDSRIIHSDENHRFYDKYKNSRVMEFVNQDNYIKSGSSQFDAMIGGDNNLMTGRTFASVVLGGYGNYAKDTHSAIVGGYNNAVINSFYGASIGGSGNAATNNYAATYGGVYNLASGIASAAIGGGDYDKGNTASGDYSLTAGGVGNTASGKYSVSIGGTEGTASGESSVSIAGGKATTDKSIAIGAGSNASANNSIAIGADSTADEDNTMSVGNASSQRRITHVAEGINGTDAVNVDQLKKAISDVTVVPGGSGDGHDKNAVHYDGDKHDIVTLDGGSNGTTITNLKAGKVTNTSTDAINGSQLYTEQESRKDGDESLSKRIGYIDNSKTYNNISSKNNVSQNLEALDKAIIVKDDGKSVTIAKDSSTKVIDVKGTNNEQRIITGVKTDGSDKSSAVNVGFLDDRIDGLHADMNKIGAGAAALAGLHPLQYDKKNPLSVSAAVGTYDGEAAVAIGAFYQKSKNLLFSVGGSVSDKVMMNVGVSGRFGKEAPDDDNKDIRDIIREEVKAQIKSMMATPEKKDEPKWNESHFVDVPENHWAKPAVDKLAKYGAIIGYGDETFRGENAATRYEVAQMVANAMGVQDKKHAADDFTDKTIDEK